MASNSSALDGVPSVWSSSSSSVNLMRNNEVFNNHDFQIQNEDFPALPGGDNDPAGDLSTVAIPLSQVSDVLASVALHTKETKHNGEIKGIITHPDGEVTNIPGNMLADQYGMAGLVAYLRTVDNPEVVGLALGYDLTTLGLNLNLPERNLFATFGGPWADSIVKLHELDAHVPEEYLTNVHVREKLPPMKLNKLSEDVLFYIFYNCVGEMYQLAAACELYSRDWRFHKIDKVWLTRSQVGGMKEQTPTFEKGQYSVFDPVQWRKIPKELKLEYKDLEEKPNVPSYTPPPNKDSSDTL